MKKCEEDADFVGRLPLKLSTVYRLMKGLIGKTPSCCHFYIRLRVSDFTFVTCAKKRVSMYTSRWGIYGVLIVYYFLFIMPGCKLLVKRLLSISKSSTSTSLDLTQALPIAAEDPPSLWLWICSDEYGMCSCSDCELPPTTESSRSDIKDKASRSSKAPRCVR